MSIFDLGRPSSPLASSLKALSLVFGFCVLGAASAVAQSTAQQPDDPPATADIDPEAIAILTHATDFLAAQEQLAVDWFVSFDVVIEGREKITMVRSGQNLLSRGQGYHATVEFGEETREYFYDGAAVQIVDVEEHSYVMAPFAQGFDALADRLAQEYEVRLPIWHLMTTTPGRELLADASAAAHLGITRLAGRSAHHLAFSDHDRDWQIWIADDDDLPEILMIVGTDPYTQGWPQFRAYFTRWDFAPVVTEDDFTYFPDEAAERMTWPRPGSAAAGTGASGGADE